MMKNIKEKSRQVSTTKEKMKKERTPEGGITRISEW